MLCKSCGKKIKRDIKYCPMCGVQVNKGKKKIKIILFGMVAILILLGAIGFAKWNHEKKTVRVLSRVKCYGEVNMEDGTTRHYYYYADYESIYDENEKCFKTNKVSSGDNLTSKLTTSSNNVNIYPTYHKYCLECYEKYYDADGECTKEMSYDGDGMLYTKIIYDTDGKLLSYIEYNNGEFLYSYEYTYDAEGKCLSRTFNHKESEYNEKIEYTYTNDGDAMIGGICDANGNFIGLSQLSYDTNGNLIFEDYSYDTGTRKIVTHDVSGHVLCEKQYNSSETLDFCKKYTYDINGNLQSQSQYRDNGTVQVYLIEYEYEEVEVEVGVP